MDRKMYMAQLQKELKHLPKSEREEALLYYKEYFDDAGPEHEAEVIEEMGPAKEAASQILKDVAIRRLEEPARALSTIWIVILALCALPIGLPLMLVVVVLGLTAVILVIVVFFTIIVTGGSLLAAGGVGIVVGIYFLATQAADSIAILGSSLILMGFGGLLLLGGILCCRWMLRILARGMKGLLKGGRKHE